MFSFVADIASNSLQNITWFNYTSSRNIKTAQVTRKQLDVGDLTGDPQMKIERLCWYRRRRLFFFGRFSLLC